MPLHYETLVDFSIVFQIVFFVAVIALWGRFRRTGWIPLVAVAVAFLLGKFNDLWQQTGLILEYPDWAFSGSLITLLLGPFIYFYVRARTEPRLRFHPVMLLHGIWLLPGAAYLAFNWWPFDAEAKIELLTSGAFDNLTALVLIPAYFDGTLILYLAISVARLRAHGIRLQDWFSNIEDRNLSGIRNLLGLFALMVGLHLFWTVGRYVMRTDVMTTWVLNGLVTYHLVLINGLFLEFLTYRHAVEGPGGPEPDDPGISPEQPAELPNPEQERLVAQLERLLSEKSPFLDPNLTVADLARPLNIHARSLSQLINQHQDCNFHEFINRRRIEHAKADIARHPEKSILEVAYDSGFNSKSAFNTAFKRFVQLTPTGYRRSLTENRD